MRTLRNCTDFYGDRRTLNVELVVALRAALSVALASETHTHTRKNTEKKEKTQIGEIPLRFSGISLFGPGAQALAKSENLHL